MSEPVKVQLNGIDWTVISKKPRGKGHIGKCDWEKRELWIAPSLAGIQRFECVLHEGLHAQMPDASEEAVERMGVELTELLRACGAICSAAESIQPSEN